MTICESIAYVWSRGEKPPVEQNYRNCFPECFDVPTCPVCGYPAERIGRCFICPNCCNSTGCD